DPSGGSHSCTKETDCVKFSSDIAAAESAGTASFTPEGSSESIPLPKPAQTAPAGVSGDTALTDEISQAFEANPSRLPPENSPLYYSDDVSTIVKAGAGATAPAATEPVSGTASAENWPRLNPSLENTAQLQPGAPTGGTVPTSQPLAQWNPAQYTSTGFEGSQSPNASADATPSGSDENAWSKYLPDLQSPTLAKFESDITKGTWTNGPGEASLAGAGSTPTGTSAPTASSQINVPGVPGEGGSQPAYDYSYADKTAEGGTTVYVKANGAVVAIDGNINNGAGVSIFDVAKSDGTGNLPSNPLDLNKVGGLEDFKIGSMQNGDAVYVKPPEGDQTSNGSFKVPVTDSPVKNLQDLYDDPSQFAKGYINSDGKYEAITQNGSQATRPNLFAEAAPPPPEPSQTPFSGEAPKMSGAIFHDMPNATGAWAEANSLYGGAPADKPTGQINGSGASGNQSLPNVDTSGDNRPVYPTYSDKVPPSPDQPPPSGPLVPVPKDWEKIPNGDVTNGVQLGQSSNQNGPVASTQGPGGIETPNSPASSPLGNSEQPGTGQPRADEGVPTNQPGTNERPNDNGNAKAETGNVPAEASNPEPPFKNGIPSPNGALAQSGAPVPGSHEESTLPDGIWKPEAGTVSPSENLNQPGSPSNNLDNKNLAEGPGQPSNEPGKELGGTGAPTPGSNGKEQSEEPGNLPNGGSGGTGAGAQGADGKPSEGAGTPSAGNNGSGQPAPAPVATPETKVTDNGDGPAIPAEGGQKVPSDTGPVKPSNDGTKPLPSQNPTFAGNGGLGFFPDLIGKFLGDLLGFNSPSPGPVAQNPQGTPTPVPGGTQQIQGNQSPSPSPTPITPNTVANNPPANTTPSSVQQAPPPPVKTVGTQVPQGSCSGDGCNVTNPAQAASKNDQPKASPTANAQLPQNAKVAPPPSFGTPLPTFEATNPWETALDAVSTISPVTPVSASNVPPALQGKITAADSAFNQILEQAKIGEANKESLAGLEALQRAVAASQQLQQAAGQIAADPNVSAQQKQELNNALADLKQKQAVVQKVLTNWDNSHFYDGTADKVIDQMKAQFPQTVPALFKSAEQVAKLSSAAGTPSVPAIASNPPPKPAVNAVTPQLGTPTGQSHTSVPTQAPPNERPPVLPITTTNPAYLTPATQKQINALVPPPAAPTPTQTAPVNPAATQQGQLSQVAKLGGKPTIPGVDPQKVDSWFNMNSAPRQGVAGIIVHQSATPQGTGLDWAKAQTYGGTVANPVRGQAPLTFKGGPNAIGAEWWVLADGTVLHTRPEVPTGHIGVNKPPGNTFLSNEDTVGIEFEGAIGQPLTDAQKASGKALVAWLQERYNISSDHIYKHGKTGSNPFTGALNSDRGAEGAEMEKIARDMAYVPGATQPSTPNVPAVANVPAARWQPPVLSAGAPVPPPPGTVNIRPDSQQPRLMTDIERAKMGICRIESSCSNPNDPRAYTRFGPVTKTGNRAYGKYQVMDFNIPSWTAQALGRPLSVAEFLSNPAAQERTFEVEFQKEVQRYGGWENAAVTWFAGPKGLNNPNASDGYTKVSQYRSRFSSVFNNTSLTTTGIAANPAGYKGMSTPAASIAAGNPGYVPGVVRANPNSTVSGLNYYDPQTGTAGVASDPNTPLSEFARAAREEVALERLAQYGIKIPDGAHFEDYTVTQTPGKDGLYDITNSRGEKVASEVPLPADAIGENGAARMLANKDGKVYVDGGKPVAISSDTTLPRPSIQDNKLTFNDERPDAPPQNPNLAGDNRSSTSVPTQQQYPQQQYPQQQQPQMPAPQQRPMAAPTAQPQQPIAQPQPVSQPIAQPSTNPSQPIGTPGSANPTPGNTTPYAVGTCLPNFLCANNTYYRRDSQCIDTALQSCQYGCSNGECAAAPGATSTSPAAPVAGISCVPGTLTRSNTMQVALSWSCNGSVASTTGFAAGGRTSGTATSSIPANAASPVRFSLTCVSGTLATTTSCLVHIQNPPISLVANPKTVQPGATATIVWAAAGASACQIYVPGSPVLSAAGSGSVVTKALVQNSIVRAACRAADGSLLTASTSVSVAGDSRAPLDSTIPSDPFPNATAARNPAQRLLAALGALFGF
ncbi:MAG: N-acetylmuramoyl-L-alanine amidase, partial [Candidatus Kaiserbacteria bacterium]|nr:N-acetylmuramoyl-L-alanine amidase [Candidatus Kaiserbacteria bacterium]